MDLRSVEERDSPIHAMFPTIIAYVDWSMKLAGSYYSVLTDYTF